VTGDDDEAAIEPVGDMARHQRERNSRQKAGESDEAEREGAMGEVVNKPTDSHCLHLLGHPRRDPHAGEEREVAMAKDG